MRIQIRDGLLVGCYLVALLFSGCSHSPKPSRNLAEIDEEIRLSSELIRLDSNNVAAHRALGNAYLEQAKIQLRMSRTRKEDYSYQTRILAPPPPGFEKSIFHFTEAARLDSLNDTSWCDLSRAYITRRTYWWLPTERPDIQPFLQKALSLNPQSSDAHYLLGMFYRRGAYESERTEALLHKAIETKPDNAEALCALAKLYQGQDRYGDAVSYARRAVNAGLVDPEAYMEIESYYWEDVLMTWYHASIRNVPLSARGLFDLGMRIFLKSGADWRYEMYTKAFELDSASPELLSEYSYFLCVKGDTAKAIEYYMRSDLRRWRGRGETFYRRVMSEHPEFVSAYVDLAASFYRAPYRSVELLKKAIAIDPVRGDAHKFLFDAYMEMWTPDSATSYLEKYVALPKPDTAYNLYSDLGWLYVRSRSFEKYSKLFKDVQGLTKTLVLEGPVRFYYGHYDSCRLEPKSIRLAYENLLGTDAKSNALVYSALANLAGYQNDSTAQLSYLAEAWSADPRNEEVASSYASGLKAHGNFAQALTICEALLKMNPDDTGALDFAGELLHELGRTKEAVRYYDRLSQLMPYAAEDDYFLANRLPASPDKLKLYVRAARLGYKAAQDTLRSRRISW